MYGLTIIGISAGVLLVLTALFRVELKNGERLFLGGFRGWLDTVVSSLFEWFARVLSYLHAGVFRTTLHYIVHHILDRIIAALIRLQKRLFQVYEKNKWKHKTIERVDSKDNVDEHLSAIAEHKRETALTPAQKRKLRKH